MLRQFIKLVVLAINFLLLINANYYNGGRVILKISFDRRRCCSLLGGCGNA
jgi:hypothetical protein